jgi:hypothetical protein
MENAGAGDQKIFKGEFGVKVAIVIPCERLTQFRNAAFPGVKSFAGRKRFGCGLSYAIGRRQITFACPKRHNAFPSADVIHSGENAAFQSQGRRSAKRF